MKPPRQLVCDVGVEKHLLSPDAIGQPVGTGGIQACRCKLRGDIRQGQRDVGRSPQQVETKRLAMQAERCDQAVVAIDESRDLVMARGDITVDGPVDDRPHFGRGRRRHRRCRGGHFVALP